MIEVSVNGEIEHVPAMTTIAQLLNRLEINSRAIAVEVNQQLQPRDTHHQTVLQPGDELEIVTLVGGG